MLDCTVAKLFWDQVRLLTGVKVPLLHPLKWARDLVDPSVISEKDAAVIICGMWSLRMSRNKRRHGEDVVPIRVAVQWVPDTAFDLWQLIHPAKGADHVVRKQQSWNKPEVGWTKCNVDASFMEGIGTAASGGGPSQS